MQRCLCSRGFAGETPGSRCATRRTRGGILIIKLQDDENNLQTAGPTWFSRGNDTRYDTRQRPRNSDERMGRCLLSLPLAKESATRLRFPQVTVSRCGGQGGRGLEKSGTVKRGLRLLQLLGTRPQSVSPILVQ